MIVLNKVAAPALPQATMEYDRPYQDQLNSVHRLFYTRLMTTFNTLIDADRGGRFLYFPYGAVQRTTDKTFTANTATQITFNQNDFMSGTSNDGTDGIHVDQAGIYNYQYSVQLANTDSQIHTAYLWLRKNGVDIPGTASKFDVPNHHGSVDGYLIAACNFYVELAALDHVELWAAVSNAAVYMEAYAAQTSPFVMPAIPSVVATLSFVSAV